MATHHFCTEDAAQYGIEESIVLQNIGFWCGTNLAKRQNIHNGRVWTYNPASAWLEITPYICPAKNIQPEDFDNEQDFQKAKERDFRRRIEKFRTVFKSLEKQGAIVSGDYNKKKSDNTKWYALADQSKLSKYQNISLEALKLLTPEISGASYR